MSGSFDWTIVVSWAIPIAIAGFVYWFYRKRQLVLVGLQKEIARQSIIRNLEEDATCLLSEKSAKLVKSSSQDDFDTKAFRFVLDNTPPWKFMEEESRRESGGWTWAKVREIDEERYWLIRPSSQENEAAQYLSSKSFQETLLFFRRLQRAHNAGILYDKDLTDLWRFILPFGFAGRLLYFKKYFQGEEDIQSMVAVINSVLKHCCDTKRERPIKYFNAYITDEEREVLTRTEDLKKLHHTVKSFGV